MEMPRGRWVLLAISTVVVAGVLGGGLALQAGAADGAYRQVLTFSEVLSLVLDNYVDPVEQENLLQGAYEGLLGGLDDRGAYLSSAEVAEWKKPAGDSVADVGLSVLKAGSVVQIVAVTPGSPADRAGIEVGDQVRRVDGRPVRTLSWDQIVRRLHGAAGSSVRLSIVHPREGFKRQDVDLTRAAGAPAAYEVEVEAGVGVIAVRDLSRVKAEALAADLKKIKGQGAVRLMVDLRNVAGGSPRDVAPIAGLFATGPAFVLKDKQGRSVETVAAKGDGAAWAGPLAVLVNGGTAGSAEALVRWLQGRREAKVFGEGTFGLGPEPKLVELPDGGGLLIPAYLWETTGGKRWSDEGIKPDTEVRAELRAEGKLVDALAEQRRRAIEAWTKDGATAEARPKAA
jgi:carboxyl-terminal processing protease